MNLLFDHHLSPRLVEALAGVYPQANHVYLAGLDRAADEEIRAYAQLEGYTRAWRTAGTAAGLSTSNCRLNTPATVGRPGSADSTKPPRPQERSDPPLVHRGEIVLLLGGNPEAQAGQGRR